MSSADNPSSATKTSSVPARKTRSISPRSVKAASSASRPASQTSKSSTTGNRRSRIIAANRPAYRAVCAAIRNGVFAVAVGDHSNRSSGTCEKFRKKISIPSTARFFAPVTASNSLIAPSYRFKSPSSIAKIKPMARTAEQIVEQLRPLGRESYKQVMMKHGVQEPFFGVAIADMKPIQKQVKRDYQLALDLYATGVYDAMYLAGLIADDAKMTPANLENWLDQANCSALSNVTVAWVAAESPHGWTLGLDWIDRPDEKAAAAGWATLSGWVALRPDAELDIPKLQELLERVEKEIHGQPTGIKYQMNGFVIAVGSYVAELNTTAMAIGQTIGKVEIKLIGACKMPSIPEYIQKVADRGKIGKKRKTIKC